jgi:thiamine-phosphate pyrophosphorylase
VNRPALRGLCALTDPTLCAAHGGVAAAVALALAGGARLVQYRDKGRDAPRRRAEAGALRELTRAAGALLIINDDPALAVAVGADGVHLGRDDAPIGEARALLGPDAVIGASCYADLALARAARAADYLAFGSFFPSPTKPGAPVRADHALLAAARALGKPLCAIGGIGADDVPALVAAGANLVAVASGVFGEPDPRAAAARYAAGFR